MLASWICRTPRFLGGEQMWLRDGHRHACDRATHTRTHARTHARAHTRLTNFGPKAIPLTWLSHRSKAKFLRRSKFMR